MIDSNNITLNLPFDESNGTSKAYDYSSNRYDGLVFGASFVQGKNGNAIQFGGEDTCEIEQNPFINLNGNWTITAIAKGLEAECGSPTKFIWAFNFGGLDDEMHEVTIEVAAGTWVQLAITKQGSLFNVYVNNAVVSTFNRTTSLVGVGLNQDFYGGDYGRGCLDDVRVYKIALTAQDLQEQTSEQSSIQYMIDGVNIKEKYGVCVADSKGVVDRPKLKNPTSISWDNYHGEVVDLQHKFYEPREITLSCFLKADSKSDFITRVSQFEQLFDARGTQRLHIDVHPIKPLVYEVYCKDAITVSKTWNEALMVGTFDLKLVEPEPVKRILKHIRVGESSKRCSITLTSTKYVNIYWGDGSSDLDVCGEGKTITHDFSDNGEYFIIVAGCIDEISDFTTNAIIVWNKL